MFVLAVICLVNVAATTGALYNSGLFPLIVFVIPMLAASVALQFWPFVLSVVFQAFCVAIVMVSEGNSTTRTVVAAVLVVVAAMLLTLSARAATGLPGSLGESMIIDLRDRLVAQGVLPPLPEKWVQEAALSPADGAQFSGDFMVAARTPGTSRLEVAMVDVSGKGLGAGTRALQLSGAFGGIIGALPPDDFLSAANSYLLRQDWDEGFATAAHLVVDLETGDFEVRTAGHPPVLQWIAGTRSWLSLPSDGPALGVIDEARYSAARGTIESGDAIVVYTDGLVESAAQDYRLGIEKLICAAERMLICDADKSADRLLAELEPAHDDRALLVLRRK